MKTLSVILALLPFLLSAQLSQAEYFWNTDPGEGNGTLVLALDNAFDEGLESLISEDISSMALTGANSFSIRVKAQDGTWSRVFKQTIYIDGQNQTITRNFQLTQAEYFWNTDPGEGNGTLVLALDNAFDEGLESLISEDISSMALTGANSFGIRVKAQDGTWSRVFKQTIYIEEEVALSTLGHNEPITMVLYPNPAHSNLTLKGADNMQNLQIIDLNGNLVSTPGMASNGNTLVIAQIPDGIYFLRCTINGQIHHFKFVKGE